MMNKLKMNGGILRMLQGFIATVVITHLFACFWFLTAKIADYSPDTWVSRKGLVDADSITTYLWSLYWSTQTVITLGYGDIPAVTTWEILLSLFWMLFGEVFYSFIVATYTSIIEGNIQIDASIQMKIKSLAELAKLAGIPFELSKKIKKIIENNYEAIYNQDDEATIIKMLPPSLRDEVLSNTFGDVVEKVKFFRDMDDVDFLWKVLPKLTPFKIEKTDVVFWKGDHAEDIYFILKGTITLYTDKGHPFIKYKDGDTLGDSDTLLNLPRDCKGIANTHVRIMLLKVTNGFVRSFRNQEKNLIEMILMARQKRDLHKKLMIEADKKAKKEAMIRMLLKNKALLYQYIMQNEKQMMTLHRKIQQSNHQLHALKYENQNLKQTVQQTIKQRKMLGIHQEGEQNPSECSDHLYSQGQNNGQEPPLFSRFFNALQKAKLQASQAGYHTADESRQSPPRAYEDNHSVKSLHLTGQGSHNDAREHPQGRSSLGNEQNLSNGSGRKMATGEKRNSMGLPANNGQKILVNTLQPKMVYHNTQALEQIPQITSKTLGSAKEENDNNRRRKTSSFATEDQIQTLMKELKTPPPAGSALTPNTGGNIENDKQEKGGGIKPQATFGVKSFSKLSMQISKQSSKRSIALEDIKIQTREKLSILDKVLISTFKKDALGDIYEQFPFLQNVTTDEQGDMIKAAMNRHIDQIKMQSDKSLLSGSNHNREARYQASQSKFTSNSITPSASVSDDSFTPNVRRVGRSHNLLSSSGQTTPLNGGAKGSKPRTRANSIDVSPKKQMMIQENQSQKGNDEEEEKKVEEEQKSMTKTAKKKKKKGKKGKKGKGKSANRLSSKNEVDAKRISNTSISSGNSLRRDQVNNIVIKVDQLKKDDTLKQFGEIKLLQNKITLGPGQDNSNPRLSMMSHSSMSEQVFTPTLSRGMNDIVGVSKQMSSSPPNESRNNSVQGNNLSKLMVGLAGTRSSSCTKVRVRRLSFVSVNQQKVDQAQQPARFKSDDQPGIQNGTQTLNARLSGLNLISPLAMQKICKEQARLTVSPKGGHLAKTAIINASSANMLNSRSQDIGIIPRIGGDVPRSISQQAAESTIQKARVLQEAISQAYEQKRKEKLINQRNKLGSRSNNDVSVSQHSLNVKRVTSTAAVPPSAVADLKPKMVGSASLDKGPDSFSDYYIAPQERMARAKAEKEREREERERQQKKDIQDSERTKFLDDLLLEAESQITGTLPGHNIGQKKSSFSVDRSRSKHDTTGRGTIEDIRSQVVGEITKKLPFAIPIPSGYKSNHPSNSQLWNTTTTVNEEQSQNPDRGVNQKGDNQQTNNNQQQEEPPIDWNQMRLEVHEEEIEFYGDPQLEGLVKFNADMGQVSLNIFETFSVFDLMKQANQSMFESLQLIESQNSIIEQRQDNIEMKLDELEQQLLKIKELKAKKPILMPIMED